MDDPTKTRVTYDLSQPKPVAPDFIEVYHLKHDNLIAVKWRRNPENDIIGYNVFSAPTANGPWIKRNKALITSLQFLDQCTEKNVNVSHYYIVQAVNAHMIQGDLSLPKRMQVELNRASHLREPVREIRRRNDWLIKTRGEEIDLYQRKYTGEKCPCTSPEKPDGKGGCPICYGTSFIGGYYDPQRIWVSLEQQPVKLAIDKYGLTVDDKPKGWTIHEPQLHDRDVFVGDDNLRYEIINIKITQGQGREIIRQTFDLIRLDPSNIIYALSRPTVEAITAATFEEEKTGVKSNDSGIFEGNFAEDDAKFVRHSPHKLDNALSADANIESGKIPGYRKALRHNIGKWAGYFSNRVGNLVKKDESIQLYSSDSTLKRKSRPDSSWIYTEGNFLATESKPFEYSCEMIVNGNGYFYYEAVGLANITKFIENQYADRLWFKKTNNIHFGVGSGEIFAGNVRAFVFCNDQMVVQKDIEGLELNEKNWLKIKFDGKEFQYFINDVLIEEFDAPIHFPDFRIVMSAGAWAGEEIDSVKPKITESIVDIYQYRSNQLKSIDLFKPELDAHFFDDHIAHIGKYDGEVLTAIVQDNFNRAELETDLWHVAHLAPGHKIGIQNGRMTFSGISLHDDKSIMAVTGEMLLDRTKGGDNESFVVLKDRYYCTSQLIVEVQAGAGGVEKSHNLITITNLDFDPKLYTCFGLFFQHNEMNEVGFAKDDGWEFITKYGIPDTLQKMKVMYDFKNGYSEFTVNDELIFSKDVPTFYEPIIVLSIGNQAKHQRLVNVFDNFKTTFKYLEKEPEPFNL